MTRMLCSLVIAALPLSLAGEWPQWRGPDGDGSVDGAGLFSRESFGLKKAWAMELGSSYAGIAAADGRVVTAVARDGEDRIVAFDDESGEELWSYAFGEMYGGHDGSHDGPLAMPVIADGTVIGLGARGALVALRATDGEQLWRVELTKAVEAPKPFYGFTATPLVVDELVVVQAGKGLAAFDLESGEARWQSAELSTEYESPIVAELLGQRQILATGGKAAVGVDPTDGSVLWTLAGEFSNSGTPMVLPGDRLLLKTRGYDLYQARRDGDGVAFDKLWSSDALRRSYALPVHHEGYLYGFDGRFLVGVDAATGEGVWKSRPPGGRALILVDDHLVVFGGTGDIVVVEADPEGYVEKARINVSTTDSFTAPSFADGRIFVRNLTDFAALEVTDVVADAAPAAPRNAFERFIASLDGARDKEHSIDHYMRGQARFPIVEDDRWVHFVYRGDVDDLAIRGSFLPTGQEVALDRVEGTDFHHKSFRIDPDIRIEYQFAVDFDEHVPDPLNPRRAPSYTGAPHSELAVGDYRYYEVMEPFDGPQGVIESFELESKFRKNTRDVHVYLPHGYGKGSQKYPLVVVPDAVGWVESGRVANTLDRVTASYTHPAVVAFVRTPGPFWQELGTGDAANYTKLIVEELLPELERRYDVSDEAEQRTILGRGHGGVASIVIALTAPGVFGNAAAYSYWHPRDVEDEVNAAIAAGKGKQTRFHITWNHYDDRAPGGANDTGKDSAALHGQLVGAGYPVAGGERRDSTGWASWSASLAESLRAFYAR